MDIEISIKRKSITIVVADEDTYDRITHMQDIIVKNKFMLKPISYSKQISILSYKVLNMEISEAIAHSEGAKSIFYTYMNNSCRKKDKFHKIIL